MRFVRPLIIYCVCGLVGALSFLGYQKEGKDVCSFKCGCDNPTVNWDNPYVKC